MNDIAVITLCQPWHAFHAHFHIRMMQPCSCRCLRSKRWWMWLTFFFYLELQVQLPHAGWVPHQSKYWWRLGMPQWMTLLLTSEHALPNLQFLQQVLSQMSTLNCLLNQYRYVYRWSHMLLLPWDVWTDSHLHFVSHRWQNIIKSGNEYFTQKTLHYSVLLSLYYFADQC